METDGDGLFAGNGSQPTVRFKTHLVFLAALNGRCTEKRVGERAMGSASSKAWWNCETGDLPRSIAGLVQNYLDKTATPLRFSALAAYPVYVLWLDFTERESRLIIDFRQTLIAFLPVGAGDQTEGDGKQNLGKSMSMHGFAFSELGHLGVAAAQTSRTGAQEERIKMLSRAISFFWNRSKRRLRVSLRLM